MQKNIQIWIGAAVVLVVIIGGVFLYQRNKNTEVLKPVVQQNQNMSPVTGSRQSTPTQNLTPTPTASPAPSNVKITTNPTTGQKTYTDTKYGFSFTYPVTFNTTYAQFQSEPKAIILPKGSADIDAKGCYQLDIQHMESSGLVGGMTFCESSGGNPAAGQLYSSYYYTILHGINYITLAYVVHTPNGCDAYKGTANYQSCVDFFGNISTTVLKQIQDSVATLTFIK